MRAMKGILLLPGLALFSLLLSLVSGAAAENVDCLRAFKPSTPARLEEIKGLLPNVDAMADVSQLNATIGTLQKEGMPKSQIVDHLMDAYCPMVARDESLTGAEKAVRVQRFAGQITQLVYSLESGLDIIINVPLTPDVVDALNTTARKQGLSGSAWVAMTVENTLQRQ
jgi:hypothetical protein